MSDINTFEDEEDDLHRFLIFNLASESFGIPSGNVKEIIAIQDITEIPRMSIFVKGVINLRGTVIPVIDLRLRFNLEEREHDDRTCIIIISYKDFLLGVIIDSVREVVSIKEEDISEILKFKKENCFSSIGKIEEKLFIIIDVLKLISKEEIELIRD